MSKVRLFGLLFCIAAIGGISYIGGRFWKLQRALAASKSPFTITYQESGYLTNPDGSIKDNKPLGTNYFIKARNSDGSVVDGAFAPNSNPSNSAVTSKRVMSVHLKQSVEAYGLSNVKSSMSMLPAEIAAILASPADPTCRTHPEYKDNYQVIGTDKLLGFDVVKILHDPPGGTATLEEWEAPGLDCIIVYGKTSFKGPASTYSSVTIKSAIRISTASPESALFAVGGVESRPSVAVAAEQQRTLGFSTLGSDLAKKLKRKDDVYDKRLAAGQQ